MRINTDFFMLKVSRVSKDIFLNEKQPDSKMIQDLTSVQDIFFYKLTIRNAETQFTYQINEVLSSNEMREIPEVTAIGACRVRGDRSIPLPHLFPVIHYHDAEDFQNDNKCPAIFK